MQRILDCFIFEANLPVIRFETQNRCWGIYYLKKSVICSSGDVTVFLLGSSYAENYGFAAQKDVGIIKS